MEYGLVVAWLTAYVVVGFAALPLASVLFSGFPDRGATFAVPVGLTAVAVVGHLVGHVAFGWPALLAGLAVLVAASAAVGDRDVVDYRGYAEATAVFAVAFLFLVAIRSVTPAIAPLPISIGEKFLDFGLLQTALQAETLPPADMWFAGEAVQYHYGGQMLTALLTTLTATAPRFAYNLALSGFYASLVTAAYGLAGAIAAEHDVSHRIAAVLGAFFVGIAGNLQTAGRVAAWLIPDSLLVSIPGVDPGEEVLSWTPTDFWFFDASRVVPVNPDNPDVTFQAATEFPLVAWLNGDLHAHMMSQPFMLLAAGVLVAYWQGANARRRWLLVGALPPVVGLVGMINIWSLPTALGLTALVVFFAPGDPSEILPDSSALGDRLTVAGSRPLEELRRLGFALGAVVVVVVGAVVWTAPFWFGVVRGGPDQSIVYWSPWTPLGALLVVHGAFLAVIGAYMARRLATQRVRPWTILAAGVVAVGAATALGVPALGVTVPLLVGGWWLLRNYPDAGFAVVLVLAGAGLVLLVELVSIDGERFNVIFKPYAHVWLFWAIATAVFLSRLRAGWPAETLDVDRERLRKSGTVLAVVVVATTGLYAGFAVPVHFDNEPVGADGPTLDGTAYTHERYPEEAAAIEWIDDRPGQPTIVTAAPGGYWWDPEEGNGASAPSSLTGTPTVLGWFHERQYRGAEPYEQRLSDVETIYEGSTDEQSALFAAYDVEYVYVGPAERASYDLTVENHPSLSVAFEEGSVVVYEID